LANIGVTTLGQLAALPRAGVARRFGKPLLAELDRAAGRMPDPRRWHQPPAYFKAGIELPSEATEADRLLFAAKRLVLQLEGYLAGRAAAVSRFTLKLRHREERATDVAIGLVTPSRDSGHFLLLLRERLERVALAEPVVSLRLEAEDIKPLAQENQSLFQDGRHGAGDWPRLIERLRSRLGNDAVQALELRPEHRPELASSHAEPGEKAVGTRCLAPRFGARPLWLLEQARALSEVHAVPLYGGKLKLLAGPERIESGWWDGKDVKRDYFVAATQDHALVWIYRERLAGERWSGLSGTSINGSWLHGRWFLHGLFG
jgi:protein ImuB